MRPVAGILLAGLALAAAAAAAPPEPAADREYAQALLRRAGVEPTREGILAFLKAEVGRKEEPAPAASEEEIRSRLGALGDEDWAARERAAAALQSIGRPALPLLRGAASGGDPEIVARAEALVEEIEWWDLADRGRLHDAAMSVLHDTGGSATSVYGGWVWRQQAQEQRWTDALSVADFWPAFRGSPAGQWRMIEIVGEAARTRTVPDAEKRLLLDRLVSVLEDPRAAPAVRDASLDHLRAATGESFGPDPAAWRRWIESRPVAEAIRVDVPGGRLEAIPAAVGGKAVSTWPEVAAALKGQAEKIRKEGKRPFVLVQLRQGGFVVTGDLAGLMSTDGDSPIDLIAASAQTLTVSGSSTSSVTLSTGADFALSGTGPLGEACREAGIDEIEGSPVFVVDYPAEPMK